MDNSFLLTIRYDTNKYQPSEEMFLGSWSKGERDFIHSRLDYLDIDETLLIIFDKENESCHLVVFYFALYHSRKSLKTVY